MSIQSLRYNNCRLEYQDESGVWHEVPSASDCFESYVIPTAPSNTSRSFYWSDQIGSREAELYSTARSESHDNVE